jgi:hypothetical protein
MKKIVDWFKKNKEELFIAVNIFLALILLISCSQPIYIKETNCIVKLEDKVFLNICKENKT